MKALFSIAVSTCLVSFFAPATASADPFDAFIGKYQIIGKASARPLSNETCNRFSFSDLTGVEVIPDRTGYRQTHLIKLLIPSGYSSLRVVPVFKDPSSLDPSVGHFGVSSGDALKATTMTGMFGTGKNEIISVEIVKSANGFHLTVSNEMRANETKTGTHHTLAACYYEADLVKATTP